jgi:hypothetical protein
MPRRTYYLGRWIKHGGWYPDLKLRLFRRSLARYVGQDPHDEVEVKGPVGRLKNDLLHYTYRDLSHQIRTIDTFSTVWAHRAWQKGKRVNCLLAILHCWWKFIETYILKRGFLDGVPGLIISLATSYYVGVRHAKLWERQQRKEGMLNRAVTD